MSTRPLMDRVFSLARVALGALFIYMGLNKALHPVEFLKLVRQYEMVSDPFILNSIAGALPWFEVFCGVLLMAGIAVRGTALVLIGMLVPFTLLILKRALAVSAGQQIALCAIRFDCGCGTGEVLICGKLLQNCGLILLSGFLAKGLGRSFALRYTLFSPKDPGDSKPLMQSAAAS